MVKVTSKMLNEPTCPFCGVRLNFLTLREMRAVCPPHMESWGFWICGNKGCPRKEQYARSDARET